MRNEYMRADWDWVRSELLRHGQIVSAKKEEARSQIAISADESLEKARSLVKPKYISSILDILTMKSGSIIARGGIIFSIGKISSYIRGAASICLYLVTVGEKIEKSATCLMDGGDALGGYLLDRIGSLAVESLAETLEEKIRKDYASKGMSVSTRFSPGYCDWPVEDQAVFARALDFSKAGVSLTSEYMMAPRKSITAMVGIGPGGVFSKRKSPCLLCGQRDCDYRR